MPKLLLLNNYHYRRGGADVVYLEQAKMFRERGWEVAQIAMQHPKNEDSEYGSYFTEKIEFGDQMPLADRLRQAVKIIYSKEASAKVAALIGKLQPDIVHAHNVYHHLSPSVLKAARDSGVPVVLTTHDLKLLCPAYSMTSQGRVCEDCRTQGRRALLRNRCMKGSIALSSLIYVESSLHSALGLYKRNLDALISPSRFVISKFGEWSWDGPPIYHVPNFADFGERAPNFSPGRYFVYFGRLSPEKGLRTLVSAGARAGVPIVLVGTGPMEQELRVLAAQLNAEVAFAGFRKGEELWRLVGDSRAMVLPAEWYENAPLTIVEAYACGKPAIGADIGGIPELIRHGHTGALFSSGNVEELATVLREYADRPDREIEAQGREGYTWALKDFTRDRHVDRLIDVYERVSGRSMR